MALARVKRLRAARVKVTLTVSLPAEAEPEPVPTMKNFGCLGCVRLGALTRPRCNAEAHGIVAIARTELASLSVTEARKPCLSTLASLAIRANTGTIVGGVVSGGGGTESARGAV